MPLDVGPVLKDWMGCEALVQRAAVLKLMNFELGINPDAAESHSAIIAPVMQHLGFLVATPCPEYVNNSCCTFQFSAVNQLRSQAFDRCCD